MLIYNQKQGKQLWRTNKMRELQKVWNDLDKAYEHMENAVEILSKMNAVTTELENAIEKFDMSEISYMKQLVEEMIENK